MGEEVKQEQPPKAEEPKTEERKEEEEPKTEERKEEEKPKAEEEKKEEPKPPPPFVLLVDLHCVGCAKKIERSIMRIRGVEGVAIDMATNQVTIKGIVEPEVVCNKIMKKTKRRAQILSPLPATEGEPLPQVVASQVSESTTVELNVNMHCEACAEQLKKKILKMRGVQTAETELSSGKVMVTGSMDPNKLVEYVYRRTKKQAKIVPKPEPVPEPVPVPVPEPGKPAEQPPQLEEPKPEEDKKEDKEAEKPPEAEQPPKEEGPDPQEQISKINDQESVAIVLDEDGMKRMVYYYQPSYVIERIPPPQLFSDENPNACCIS